jgi:hypothetical protein
MRPKPKRRSGDGVVPRYFFLISSPHFNRLDPLVIGISGFFAVAGRSPPVV